ncbi:MAG: excinuclease ABC subunit UvrC [Parachlamydiales bacterium]|nr:excinuclease ABC subunit UvrC [Parachlamydiales bacterium]
MFDLQLLETFPKDIGVYIMYDEHNRVIYVGKSKNIRTRVRQYFSDHDTRPQIRYLRQEIVRIETIVVKNEKEALILENNLIKQHQPKYNLFLKDDKTYISLLLTTHKWPMLRIARYKNRLRTKGKFFGPYTNAKAARQTLDLILRLFPLRQCSDQEILNRTRPCLLYDMKRCVAPCVGKCTHEEYDSLVQKASLILLGKDKSVVRSLKEEMQKASKALEFEKAQDLLEMIYHIEHITQMQHVDNPFGMMIDALGLYRENDSVTLALLKFREGKLIGAEHFSFTHIAESDENLLESFLLQYYKNNLPKMIAIPLSLSHAGILEEMLSKTAQQKISLICPRKGKRKELVELARKNAIAQFSREKQKQSLQEKYLLSLQETFDLVHFPQKIICFDTSHIAYTDPVAAMVTFINGKNIPAQRKLFVIRNTEKGDIAALEHVLQRHFAKNDLCDLLIVDGGRAQLNIALKVFQQLGIASIDVLGIAKEKGRHDKGLTQEHVFVAHKNQPIVLPIHSPLLFLLQNIRDEAHRTAISFHQKRRAKRMMTSSLDMLEGIGPIKRKKLLTHFKSMEKIQKASKEDLEKIEVLTKKDIERLLSFHKKR